MSTVKFDLISLKPLSYPLFRSIFFVSIWFFNHFPRLKSERKIVLISFSCFHVDWWRMNCFVSSSIVHWLYHDYFLQNYSNNIFFCCPYIGLSKAIIASENISVEEKFLYIGVNGYFIHSFNFRAEFLEHFFISRIIPSILNESIHQG